jgi:hypothetical protein
VAPIDPDKVTGYLYCYDESGSPETGVTIQLKMKSYYGFGASYDTKIRSEISNSEGLIAFINLLPGATYQVRRGTEGSWTDLTVPSAASGLYALPDVLGEEG